LTSQIDHVSNVADLEFTTKGLEPKSL